MFFFVFCVPMTCRIDQYTPDLTQEEVDTSFHLALKIWSDAAPLKFIKVNHDKADIILSFAKKSILTLNHSPFSSAYFLIEVVENVCGCM